MNLGSVGLYASDYSTRHPAGCSWLCPKGPAPPACKPADAEFYTEHELVGGWVITHPFPLVEKGRGRKEWVRKHGVCEAASFQALDTILLAGLDNPAWTLLQAAHRQGTHTVHTHRPMQDFSSVKLHKLLTPRNMVMFVPLYVSGTSLALTAPS
jgi:hypothetical protein